MFFFNPGLRSQHKDWFADYAIHRLIRRGVPLFGTSIRDDDYVGDLLGLECYGFTDVGDPVENPFAVATENDTGHFAKCLWRFPTGTPPYPTEDYDAGSCHEGHDKMCLDNGRYEYVNEKPTGASPLPIVNRQAYDRMETLNMILVESFQRGHMNEIHRLGVACEIETDVDRDTFISLPFGHWLSKTMGTLYLETEDGLAPWMGHVVEPADVRAYPGPDASLYRRAVWAADVTMKYDIRLETLELAQTWFDTEDTSPDEAGFTNIEKIFSDRTHLQPSLEMMLSRNERLRRRPSRCLPQWSSAFRLRVPFPPPSSGFPPACDDPSCVRLVSCNVRSWQPGKVHKNVA